MRALLAILGGFVLTLAVFGSGLAVAAWFLAAEPVQQARASTDVTDLWTREARAVNPDEQNLDRLPARHAATLWPQQQPAQAAAGSGVGSIEAAAAEATVDTATTASIGTSPDSEPQRVGLPAEHLEWCARRYRSYQPQDNTYRPYSGGKRPCVSPYLAAAEEAVIAAKAEPLDTEGLGPVPTTADESFDDAGVEVMSAEVGYQDAAFQVTSDHVAYCFARYRSYRPEDNTYQPYGGGPRRQCQ